MQVSVAIRGESGSYNEFLTLGIARLCGVAHPKVKNSRSALRSEFGKSCFERAANNCFVIAEHARTQRTDAR